MAGCTVLIPGIRQIVRCRLNIDAVPGDAERARTIMAFQAYSHDDWPPQQFLVHRAMRVMAGLAAFDFGCRVLENKWPALIGMTFQAGLFVRQCMIHHSRPDACPPGWSVCSVWIMAVRALDETFVHPVLRWHGKLRSHGGMATITEIGLPLGEQRLRIAGWLVNRMAIIARDIGQRVRTAPYVGA